MLSLGHSIFYFIFSTSRIHIIYSVAAADTAPAALKAVLFVNSTLTGYNHSMYLAQPL